MKPLTLLFDDVNNKIWKMTFLYFQILKIYVYCKHRDRWQIYDIFIKGSYEYLYGLQNIIVIKGRDERNIQCAIYAYIQTTTRWISVKSWISLFYMHQKWKRLDFSDWCIFHRLNKIFLLLTNQCMPSSHENIIFAEYAFFNGGKMKRRKRISC